MHNAERRKQQFPSGMRMTELLAKVFVKNLVRVATNSRPVANRNPITLYFAQRPDGGEMQALMEEAERDLKAIRSAAGRITDVRTHEDALALTETGDRLYCYLREHPEKISSANRFLIYYLDTVGRILGQYVNFQDAGLGTSEVREFQRKVRAILPKLKTGFEEQLSQLMASERFDAEADMKVMEGLLNTEGFQWEANQNGSV